MNEIKQIALLPGDGIGPEIMTEAVRVLEAIGKRFNRSFQFTSGRVGVCAMNQCDAPYPDETHALCLRSDAILFGAIGDPSYDNNPKAKVRPEQGLLQMRKKLGLFANLRPVVCFPSLMGFSPLKEDRLKDVDFVVYRELTGGIYFGERGRDAQNLSAFDTCVYSRSEIARIAHLAFQAASKRKKHVTLVDKANILETSRLWREVVQQIQPAYPDIQVDFLFVDNAAMQLITQPQKFDVILTDNMFGDILTDEASVIGGSLGLLPSASLGERSALFEPIHGSYPQAKGKNIANPVAMILSAAMMLEYAFHWLPEADCIRDAVNQSFEAGIVTEDLTTAKAYSTTDVGNWIANYILS